MYKVCYYLTPKESMVGFKFFKTLHEAITFANTKGEDILEIKKVENES